MSPAPHLASPSVAPLVRELDLHRVHTALAQSGISHQRFADAVGLSRPHLSNVLLGHTPAGPLAKIRISYGLRLFAIDESAVAPDA